MKPKADVRSAEFLRASCAHRDTLCLPVKQCTQSALGASTARLLLRRLSPISTRSDLQKLIALLTCLPLSDCLGSSVFGLIKSDINGNITVRIRLKGSDGVWPGMFTQVCLLPGPSHLEISTDRNNSHQTTENNHLNHKCFYSDFKL